MAKARMEIRQVEKKVATDEKLVNLELTMQEARVLKALVGSIGGSSQDTYRTETDPIYYALSSAGVGSSFTYKNCFTGEIKAKEKI